MFRLGARAALRLGGAATGGAVAVGAAGALLGGGNRREGLLAAPRPAGAQVVRCHCQVPCGIFHDDGRLFQLVEDAMTIRKAVTQMQELHRSGKLQDQHQMMRWIVTKEEHAAKIMHIIADYFLAQKVKKELLSEHDYHEVLALHHGVMVAAMKTKQSSEVGPVDALDQAIAALKPVYQKK
mmetsp:Transcript_172826/g.554048  ORF Transcript_172826/g.554048 Transcript_172826/m.554048 type:complete len:181 (-) Transcript_172826:384-926(-)